MTDAPPTAPARAPWLLLAGLVLVVALAGVVRWPEPEGPPATEADLQAALEERHGPADAPIPGTLNEYRLEFNPGYLRVTDGRGDWLWIALEGERATEMVFGIDVGGGGVDRKGDGLSVRLLGGQVVAAPLAPERVRVATAAGVEERAVTVPPHQVAKDIFEGRERRPLRDLLEAISKPR